MKKFLINTFIFILPILIVTFPLDYLISYYLKKSHSFSGELEVWNDIYEKKAGCDIAIYGSSRAWVHINPKILEDSLKYSVYNFGIDGHNFWLQYLRHLELVKYNRKPKVIILSVDNFSLQKRIELYQPEQFLPYMLYNKDIIKYTSSFKGYKKYDYYVPLLRYAGKRKVLKTCLRFFLKGYSKKNFREKGFVGMERTWNSDLDKAKEKIGEYKIKIDPKTLELFENFIRECIESNIKLIFVYCPEYIEGQHFVKNRKQIINIYKKLAIKYKLIYLDYSEDEISKNRDLFYNANHLNKNGAEIFSKKLAHDLKLYI
jgi:hypothetical protein